MTDSSTPKRVASPTSAAAVALATALAISGCSSSGSTEAAAEPPADELFRQAETELRNGRDVVAAGLFDEVERLYPTSQWAKRAMIMSAYASYEGGEYDKAILSAERFLDFYPSDKDAAYAQYLVAVSHYDQIVDVGRDQARTRAALQSLRELVNRYPDSEYAREGRLKLDLTLDHLAGKEMEIGRYYLKRGNYIGAIERFRVVVERYQTTSHVEEALHRLVEAYLALGVNQEAQAAAAVLGHNFPGSAWYIDSYALLTGRDLTPVEDADSWITRVWRRVVKNEWL